ncbi:unnamed protein product [Lathyrus oleraceus]|uniref:mitogen-activated protein kinase kinase kinase n=1 Tax=Pisum sativum TaxID=3888 RepID=A0A9D4WFE5_PEA|nr:mitogen-activated protein kinase kinase kinase NPK1-like isoform X2 [Pisum sativum]KAI5400935.1 Mitogen-activated protein kinase kinase kinase 3 [Pisum sativum]
MQDFFGSIRRSIVFSTPPAHTDDGRFTGFANKIGSAIRKSRIGLKSPPPPPPPHIRWRKGELIGSGAFGRVYMGMNLDSGELIAVKQVLIEPGIAFKANTQANIRELEEEVKLLKNLKHPNIVRYLGTAREEDSLNILLEFVPGGSISSLLGKFGSFPESVIRTYTKQLLEGLEYLHNNRIIHRDIKGANILVDNKGCIKLADFGASRKVVELATINGAKSMKGTPHWMSPEVILQTGYTTSADIWSVACTVIEMATGKPPWSQQYPQEVSALFYIGTTRSHPPIPEHLSAEAKDFLLKCFHKEPDLRPSASDLLLHPFITCEYQESHSISRSSVRDSCNRIATDGMNSRNFLDSIQGSTCTGLKDVCQMDSLRFSNANLLKPGSYQGAGNYDDDMCQMDDDDDIFAASSVKANSLLAADDIKSFNPMCEPVEDGWSCKSDETLNLKKSRLNLYPDQTIRITMSPKPSPNAEKEFSFSSEPLGVEDDDEVTECKIRAFLDDKAFELNKLQTPLYEEFFGKSIAAIPPVPVEVAHSKVISDVSNVKSKSRSPSQDRRRFSMAGIANVTSPESHRKYLTKPVTAHCRPLQEIQPSELYDSKETLRDAEQGSSVSPSFSERQRKWKEELAEELERTREVMRQTGGGKITSPKDRSFLRD